MEFVPLVGPALQVLKVLQETADKDQEIRNELKIGIRTLRDNLKLIEKGIEEYEEQELQELADEIEDFLPDILIRNRLSFILTAMRLNRGSDQMFVIKYLQGKMENIKKRASTSSGAPMMGKSGGPSWCDAQLVGDAKSELMELLSEAGELRVVSIVGCSGLGKTALAKALYSDAKADKKFDFQAFVVASECSEDEAEDHVMNKAKYLLRKILRKDRDTSAAPSEDTSNLTELTTELHTKLNNTRYLVVVDDIKEVGLCKFLKEVFPNDKTSGSRIIVTTRIQSVATALSCGHYRYTMRGLSNEDSKKLLSREMFCSEPNESIINSAEIILSKCKGSPLALIGAGKHLMGNATTTECQRVGKALATEVSDATKGSALWELKTTLVDCYSSLPKYHDRRCLLSVIMCPRDHQLNKNSLLRRWIAEGLVYAHQEHSGMDVATKSFDQFVDCSIVSSGLTGSNSKCKGYQVQGIMLEFIIHKSTCVTNFATIIDPLIHPGGRLPIEKDAHSHIRRLFVSEGAESCIKEIENHLDFIRWLTICHNPTSTSIPFDLSKCQLLRVLDLEGCKGVNGTVLANICRLVKYLKYLSLRGSDVSHIPKEITQLVNLETLDIRETDVDDLTMEILLMPGLAHLFGKFELVGSYKELVCKKEKQSHPNELVMGLRRVSGKIHTEKYFEWESKLETLSGVTVDNDEENLKEIMLRAKKLKKVKIWCKKMNVAYVLPVKKFSGSEALDSLSVDSSNQPIDMLTDGFLESLSSAAWAIQSLKLRGPLQGLPATPGSFMKLKQVRKLCLSSTGRKWEALSILQNMSCLLKLKLAEDSCEIGEGSFIVENGGFPSLQQLCIEAPELPKVHLKEGATRCLLSLELMIFDVTQINNHATAEISSPQRQALLQIEATPEIITSEPEAYIQTKDLFCSLKRTIYAKARKVGIYIRLRCNLCWSQAPVQTGATTKITIGQPEQSIAQTEATPEITTHEPVHTGVSSEITQLHVQTGGASGFTTNELVQIGAASQITTHQPDQTAAVSEITAHQQVESSVQNGATTGDTSYQEEQNAIQTGATSEITSHRPAQTGAASEITIHQQEQAAVQNGSTSQITLHQQVEPSVQNGVTSGDTSYQEKHNAIQIRATSKITSHRLSQTREASEITIHQPEKAVVKNGATLETTPHQQMEPRVQNGATAGDTSYLVEPRVQTGATTGDTSPQQEHDAIQTGATSEVTHLQQVVSAQTIEEIELYLGVGGLLHLLQLDEVIINHSTGDKAMQYWEEVSNRHINKPYIKKSSPGQKTTPQPPQAN